MYLMDHRYVVVRTRSVGSSVSAPTAAFNLFSICMAHTFGRRDNNPALCLNLCRFRYATMNFPDANDE